MNLDNLLTNVTAEVVTWDLSGPCDPNSLCIFRVFSMGEGEIL
jgi:hypothetical protein